MTRTIRALLLLIALILLVLVVALAILLLATDRPAPAGPTEVASVPQPAPSLASIKPAPTSTPAEVVATLAPRPPETMPAFASPTPAGPAETADVLQPTPSSLPSTKLAPPNTPAEARATLAPLPAETTPATASPAPTTGSAPWVRRESKVGIHLLLDDDRNHWPPEQWPQHLQAARQIVGEGGYVVQLIRLDDLRVQRWQLFLDLCAQEHLVPIIRLAGTYDHDEKWWKAPPKDAGGEGYTEVARQYRDFFAQLRWPTEPRYVIVGNEPNRGDEWSNRPDPVAYAQYLLDVGQALHSIGVTVLGPALDLYAPHSNGQLINGHRYIDAETFLDEMAIARPQAFEAIDVWAAHAYPLDPFRFDPSRQEFRIDYANGATNPRHLQPPAGMFNRGVNSYRWELWKLEQLIGPRAATLPVLITESGWRHGPSQDPAARDSVHAEISFATQSTYLDLAFRGNHGRYPGLPETGWTPWNDDLRVLGVVLFALGGFPKDWGHTNWVTLDDQGRILSLYPIALPIQP